MTPTTAPTPEWSGFRSFLNDEIEWNDRLITPVRMLWKAYCKHCEQWGFPQINAAGFVRWLRETDGLVIVEAGQGRIRRLAKGVHLRRNTWNS